MHAFNNIQSPRSVTSSSTDSSKCDRAARILHEFQQNMNELVLPPSFSLYPTPEDCLPNENLKVPTLHRYIHHCTIAEPDDLGEDPAFEYLDDDDGAHIDLQILEDGLEPILNLDLFLLRLEIKMVSEQDEDLCDHSCDDSCSIDSINITRRRFLKKGNSKMQILKDFRQAFKRPAMSTFHQNQSRKTHGPPSA